MKTECIINIVFDENSWIEDYISDFILKLKDLNFRVHECNLYADMLEGYAAFFLGCTKIANVSDLNKNKFNLVVHESDLPAGKGFAPLTWQILEGKSEIPVCLIDAAEKMDSGDIYLKDFLRFEGHELCADIRKAQAEISFKLCLQFLTENPSPFAQAGEESFYVRRTARDSELSLTATLNDLFPLLRVADNKRYPAYFVKNGIKYKVLIEQDG
ncbi:MAG: hypothetical protein V7765_04395 [Oleispira sp.]